MTQYLEFQLLAAFLVDLLIGDPRWLPHPVRIMGWYAAGLERVLRRLIRHERAAGFICVCLMLAGVAAAAVGVVYVGWRLHPLGVPIVGMLMIYFSIAVNDLLKHARVVHQALAADNLEDARRLVGRMVGRDTDKLDEAGVVRAAVESVAENIVDGITAPLFYALLLGPLGAILYRAINTMDSMFGYKNERYLHFGRMAARLDDVANFIPARLTAPLISLAAALMLRSGRRSFRIFCRDARCHASPNSGLSEAAVAGALGVQLGGPSWFRGVLANKPLIGDPTVMLTRDHILQTNRLILLTACLFLCFGILLRAALIWLQLWLVK